MKQVKEMTPKKWGIWAIAIILTLVVGMALLTYIVDPYFHFHAPIEGMSYRLYEQRYINDGISRHFDYDTIVIGNSLSENVKTSQVDELFDCKSIKLPYSGAGYKELWESIERALVYNKELKRVIVFVDTDDAVRDKDYVRYSDYPEYLYDDIIWNDAFYLWNLDTFYRGTLYNLLMTLARKESTTFDEYSVIEGETGPEVVLPLIGEIPSEESASRGMYKEDDREMTTENVNSNIIRVVEKYPEVQFLLIYAPPSIARWAKYYIWGDMRWRLGGAKTTTELLLKQDNVKLYSFQDEFDIVCDLNNYRDTLHYTSEISEFIMENVAKGNNEITKDNYQEYFEKVEDFYLEYDYQSLKME